MHAPTEILRIYQHFDRHPMENLTKAWIYSLSGAGRQRTVEQMRKQRGELGLSGNCFDLTLWLLEEFSKAGLLAYGVGHNLHTDEAHVAVVVHDNDGYRYLCDLGDQWIQPVLIDKSHPAFTTELRHGFFPAAG